MLKVVKTKLEQKFHKHIFIYIYKL